MVWTVENGESYLKICTEEPGV